MKIPQLKSCCCGYALRTGTKFVAWFALICGSIEILDFLLLGRQKTSDHPAEDFEREVTAAAVKCVLNAARVIFSFALLRSIYQKKPILFKPWLMFDLAALLIEIFLIFIALIIVASWDFIFILIVNISIHAYYILVVYSDYREEMEKEKETHYGQAGV